MTFDDGGHAKDYAARFIAKADADQLAAATGRSARRGVIRRWRERLQRGRAERLDRRIHARENLRDFKRYTGDEGGPMF